MSYILDALRKSEQERLRGAVPNLLTVHTAPVAYSQPISWRYGTLALVLISLGVLIGWLRPWQPERHHSAAEPTAAIVPETSPRPALPARMPETAPRPVQLKPAPELAIATKPAAQPEPAPTKPEPAQAQTRARAPAPQALARAPAPTPAPVRQAMEAPVKEPPAPVHPAAPAPTPGDTVATAPLKPAEHVQQETLPEPQKVLQLAELPPAVQQEIPQLSIPVHTYSTDPRQRIVGINGRLMQEGDYLAPDLKLEQITPDGVIFSYKSYRFHYGLP